MKLSELVSKHLWGCAVGWGTKEQQADIEFQKQWCNCGILEARAEYAAQQSAQDGEVCPDCHEPLVNGVCPALYALQDTPRR